MNPCTGIRHVVLSYRVRLVPFSPKRMPNRSKQQRPVRWCIVPVEQVEKSFAVHDRYLRRNAMKSKRPRPNVDQLRTADDVKAPTRPNSGCSTGLPRIPKAVVRQAHAGLPTLGEKRTLQMRRLSAQFRP
jgi:hypothetical protein